MTTVAYIGNFVPEHSTENHVARAWEHHGHKVVRVQEGELDQLEAILSPRPDLILWTRTGDLAAKVGHEAQLAMLSDAASVGIPTVGFHLDRWWGLNREHQIFEEPFFKCSLVITADGGHDEQFKAAGVNHLWMPPAVSLAETELGTMRSGYRSDLAFCGSWQAGYHAEWTHRPELIKWMRSNYGQRFITWPRPNQPSLRGEPLRDLYASVKVMIGDSCLSGGATRYWSDRIPETVGRGGFLLHPWVEGLDQHFNIGVHLDTWQVGDWQMLDDKISYWLRNDAKRRAVAANGRDHVRKEHTYEKRVLQILEVLGL